MKKEEDDFLLYPQRCKVCGKRDKMNFNIHDDEIWKAVVPVPYQTYVVCLSCFDAFASQRGVNYADAIDKEVCFVGDAAGFTFHIKDRSSARFSIADPL